MDEVTSPVANEPHAPRPTRVAPPRGAPIPQLVRYFFRLGFQADDGEVVKLGQARLADNAHTVAVDPATHLVYFPLRNVGGKSVLRVMAPRERETDGQ